MAKAISIRIPESQLPIFERVVSRSGHTKQALLQAAILSILKVHNAELPIPPEMEELVEELKAAAASLKDSNEPFGAKPYEAIIFSREDEDEQPHLTTLRMRESGQWGQNLCEEAAYKALIEAISPDTRKLVERAARRKRTGFANALCQLIRKGYEASPELAARQTGTPLPPRRTVVETINGLCHL